MEIVERGEITALLEAGLFSEGSQVEAKQALRGFPRNAWETVSAFANSEGGVIILGLAEEGDDWRAEGVADPEALIQDVINQMRNPQKISVEVTGSADLWIEPYRSRSLVVMRVAPAPVRMKPVYLNGNPASAWLRRSEADSRCTPEELARMLREASPVSFDDRVVPFLGMSDFNADTVERFRQQSEDARPELPHHTRTGQDYLRSIGAWRIDRERGTEGPTIAGLLVLGTDDAIQAIRSNHIIDYRRVPTGHTPTRRWTDRIQWSGNLFDAWETIFPRLTRGLPVPFRLQGPKRIDRPAGLDALREAMVNLLVHTDYQELSDAVILHRDNGYVFRNPGDSRVNVQDLGIHDRSLRRNNEIAKLFHLVGLADRAGSGFMRIFDEWKSLGFRRPYISSDPVQFEFTLELSLAGLLPADDRAWLESFGEGWREDEELALWLARRTGAVDNQTLREMTGQHMGDASRTLVSLKNRGYFVSQGAGRNVYYVLGSEAPSDDTAERTDSDRMAGEGTHKPGEGAHKPDESTHKPDEGAHKPDEGTHKPGEGDRSGNRLAYLHRESLVRVIAPIRDTQRAPSAQEMRDAVLAVCAIEPLSVAQLTDLSKRSRGTIRRYIQELQRERKLKRAESVPGQRVARYVTVSTNTALQKPLILAPDEE